MDYNLEQLIEQISQNKHFQGLEKVVENNPYHNNENVYSHSLAVSKIARQAVKGDFINSQEAKQSFLEFMDQKIGGMRRADILVLVALTHDVGKGARVKENGQERPVVQTMPDGKTKGPGHEYISSVVLDRFLEGVNIPQEVVVYMKKCIKLHDTFNKDYFDSKKEMSPSQMIDDIKLRAEGNYKEALFNIYCDNFNADSPEVFQFGKQSIVAIFNEPDLYRAKEYLVD